MRDKNYYIVMMLAALFIFFQCTGAQKMTKKEGSGKNERGKTGVINENFNPPLFDENELKLKKTISPESKSDNIDDLLLQAPRDTTVPDEIDGFRVQICAVSDKEKAREVQQEAILRFIDQEVYLKYDSPYYKVRVGDCLTRYEAEKLQQLAIEKGFTDAWVVRTKVKPKAQKSSPQESEAEPPN